jgi:hypothetical protein
MNSCLRLLAVVNVVFLLSVLGCGDEGSCGPAPERKEEPSGGGGGMSGTKGSSSGSAELNAGDKKGRVMKPYRRPTSAYEPGKSTATISKPIIAVSSATAAARLASSLPVFSITKRGMDGVADRVEVACRVMASIPSGQCSNATNYAEIKERCCPGGLVERCRATMWGVVLVGRGCEPAKR